MQRASMSLRAQPLVTELDWTEPRPIYSQSLSSYPLGHSLAQLTFP